VVGVRFRRKSLLAKTCAVRAEAHGRLSPLVVPTFHVQDCPIKAVTLLNEDEVVNLASAYLETCGWVIIHKLNGNQSGIDIVAERNGQRLLIEAKGCTTGASPDRAIHIQPHRTNSSIAAVGKAVYLYDGVASIALALPDEHGFRAQIERAQAGLKQLGVAVLWVSHEGVRRLERWGLRMMRASHIFG
jgi:hypothetical protein